MEGKKMKSKEKPTHFIMYSLGFFSFFLGSMSFFFFYLLISFNIHFCLLSLSPYIGI